jgi:hypothetical protein
MILFIMILCIFNREICINLFVMTFLLDISYGYSIDDFDKDNAMTVKGHLIPRSILSQFIGLCIAFSH